MNAEASTELFTWLDTLPHQDGHYRISDARRFQHQEADYDEQYGNRPINLRCGHGAVVAARERDADMSGPALEIGCGTGLLSLGLVHGGAYPAVLLTDPSPTFLEITRKKLEAAEIGTDEVRFAVMDADDTGRLPAGMFSLIALRSTLHHILDVDRFIADATRALRPCGALMFEEPCLEGYVLMGAMAQFMPVVAAAAGERLTDRQEKAVRNFVETMRFYARRDVDKSTAEDKHLFRVDELMSAADRAGLTLTFAPNMTFDHYGLGAEARPASNGFRRFFRDYLQYCMSFDEALMRVFDRHLAGYCDYLDSLTGPGSAPYMHGVFVALRGGDKGGRRSL